MRTIHEYTVLPGKDTQMLKNAVIIDVHSQGPRRENICVWAIVDTDEHLVDRKILVFGTGHELERNAGRGDYLGSVHDVYGQLVFHLFDLGEVRID